VQCPISTIADSRGLKTIGTILAQSVTASLDIPRNAPRTLII